MRTDKPLVTFLLAMALTPAGVVAASFTPLGDLAGGEFASYAYGVADTGIVAGVSRSANGLEAFRWTAVGGMENLGTLNSATKNAYSQGAAISANGNVIVGVSGTEAGLEAFRWTADAGLSGLGAIAGGFPVSSDARGVSDDGLVTVGTSNSTDGTQPFLWTAATGPVGLGRPPGDPSYGTYATGISGDGTVVVGINDLGAGSLEAVRWTADAGFAGLGYLEGYRPQGGVSGSRATGASFDGRVVVGYSDSGQGPQAFRWTEAGGMTGIGDLPGGVFSSIATDVSGDGSIIVGTGSSAGNDPYNEAFLWTEAEGIQRLLDVLVARGATGLEGWALASASAISGDGRWVAGYGYNPAGLPEAYLADITPVPIPPTLGLLGCGLGLGLAWSSRRLCRKAS